MKENKVLKLAIPFFKERALHRALAVVVAIAVVFSAVGCIGLLSARASDDEVSASDVVPGEVTSPADVPIDGDAVKAPAVKATGMTTPQITMQAPDGALSFNVKNATSGAPIYIDWGDGNLVEGAFGANSGTVVGGTVKLYCDADITSLDVKGTDVLAIDASQAEGLESINAANSALMSLNVQGCSALTTLRVEGSILTELDASGLENLTDLYANDCALTSLNVNGCSALGYLDASGNIIESVDLGGCESLYILDVEDNLLTELDASECTALEELQASCNLLEDIAVNSEMLWGIYANDNLLSAIDLSGAPYIEVLTVSDNFFTSLDDITGGDPLYELEINNNFLTEADLGAFSSLEWASVSDNAIESVNVPDTVLEFYCDGNALTFETLPEDVYDDYVYENQADIEIAATVAAELDEIDLSSQLREDGETVFNWYDENGDVITPATEAGGKFTFSNDDAGKTVYCEMTNPALPDVVIYTTATEIIPVYTVTFVDIDGNVLKEEKVAEGDAATAPTAPELEGHDFLEWDTAFDNVTEDLVVGPVYEAHLFNVDVIINGNGVVNFQGEVFEDDFTITEVPYGDSVIMTITSVGANTSIESIIVDGVEYPGDGDGDYELSNITSDTVVEINFKTVSDGSDDTSDDATSGNGTSDNIVGYVVAVNALLLAAGALIWVYNRRKSTNED